MIIRPKELKDCESWIDINVNSWNENLRGIVSDKLLNYLKENKESRIKKDIEDFQKDDWNYVLEDNDKVIGIMKIKQSEREDYKDCGEVQMLYLYTQEKGKGYGKALLNKGLEILKNKGFKKVVIGCLENNSSNEFYKHMGGVFIRQEPWDVLGEHYNENVYEYDLGEIK